MARAAIQAMDRPIPPPTTPPSTSRVHSRLGGDDIPGADSSFPAHRRA